MREMQTQATVSYQLTPLGKVSVRKTEAEKLAGSRKGETLTALW